MNITVLEEDTAGESGLPAEHGLCLYIETEKHKLLMDTGASELSYENACALGKNVSDIDTIIISHGHYDHAGGLLKFAKECPNAEIYMRRGADGEYYNGEKFIGIDKRILSLPRLHLTGEKPLRIDDELTVFSGIECKRANPRSNRSLFEKTDGEFVPDKFRHEQCLVIQEKEKSVLLSGCAHNGILNITDRFFEIFGKHSDAVISGFHMYEKSEYTDDDIECMENTAYELVKLPTVFYTGHCTGKTAFDTMKPIMKEQLHQIHSGDGVKLAYL